MDLLFKTLVVGVAPQPRKMPPQPFEREDLQRAFFDVGRAYSYSQFAFLPADSGAQFLNGPDDRTLVTPGLIQVVTPIDLTPQRSQQKVVDVVTSVSTRLGLETFLQFGIKVVAHAFAPGATPDARAFVSERLMGGSRSAELGPDFFGGGVKYRSIRGSQEENLLIEPLVADEERKTLWLDYDVQRLQAEPTDLTILGGWIEDAFDFVRGPVINLLEV